MENQFRIVKVSYSEELPSESALWFNRFLENAILNHLAKNDSRMKALLISKKIL